MEQISSANVSGIPCDGKAESRVNGSILLLDVPNFGWIMGHGLDAILRGTFVAELQTLFLRPDHFAHRWLDDIDGDALVGLPSSILSVPIGIRRFRQPIPDVSACAFRRGLA